VALRYRCSFFKRCRSKIVMQYWLMKPTLVVLR
jgi:hypothetical protein